MSENDIWESIHKLVAENKVEGKDVSLLILAELKSIHQKIDAMDKQNTEQMTQLKAQISAVKEIQDEYPSITWLWAYRRKDTIVFIVLLFAIYTVVIYPTSIGLIRQLVFSLMGIDLPDLSIPVSVP